MAKPTQKLIKKEPTSNLPFKIERNIPLPTKRKDNPYRDVFKAMDIGDSFLIGTDRKAANYVQYQAQKWGKENDANFAFRTTTEGQRCWRIK